MIDLHSHLLPNLDDGARSLEQALGVIGLFHEVGVTGLVLTPHLRAGEIVERGSAAIDRRDAALTALRAASKDRLRLYPGFEIMLDEPLPAAATADRRYALAGSRYYLVEFPLSVVGDFTTAVLGRIADAGVVPVVAHPERYAGCGKETVAAWRGAGARIQVDATTLARPTARGQRARALVAAGLADVLAADNHGDSRSVATAVRYLTERAGDAGALAGELLTVTNPRAVVHDADLSAVPPIDLGERLVDRLKRFLEG